MASAPTAHIHSAAAVNNRASCGFCFTTVRSESQEDLNNLSISHVSSANPNAEKSTAA